MKYNEIMPECFIDTTLVASLLDAKVSHKHSCNEVRFPLPSSLMSSISDAIQAKCLAFGDRIIKLNDYLLEQASQKYDGGSQKYDVRKGKSSFSHQASDLSQTSYFKHLPSRNTSNISKHIIHLPSSINHLEVSHNIGSARTCSLVSVRVSRII